MVNKPLLRPYCWGVPYMGVGWPGIILCALTELSVCMALLGARPGIAPDESGDWWELLTPQKCRHVWTPKNWEGHFKVTCFPCFPVLYLHFFLDISMRMQNSPRLAGCMSFLIQVAVNYEIGRIFIYLYYISMMGTLLEECLPSIGPTFCSRISTLACCSSLGAFQVLKMRGAQRSCLAMAEGRKTRLFRLPWSRCHHLKKMVAFVRMMTIGSLGGGFNMFQPIWEKTRHFGSFLQGE